MPPGDREWAVADDRDRNGIPLDIANQAAFAILAEQFNIPLPVSVPG